MWILVILVASTLSPGTLAVPVRTLMPGVQAFPTKAACQEHVAAQTIFADDLRLAIVCQEDEQAS